MKQFLKWFLVGFITLISLGGGLWMGAIAQSPQSTATLPLFPQLTTLLPQGAPQTTKEELSTSPLEHWTRAIRVVDFVRPAEGYGHLPYAEAKQNLIVVGSYSDWQQRFERMENEAGLALMKMMDAARQDGVWIVPVSGFRDVQRQKELFDSQVKVTGSVQQAAESVAPPGYSEHHTGLAIDLTDGMKRGSTISSDFAKTSSYRWLRRNAKRFGFELSFPPRNVQGVKYEPWHWRYVGSAEAKDIFRAARGG